MSALRSWVLLAGLILAAAALRFLGLDFLLPQIVEPDPHIPVQVRLIENEHPDPHSVMDWPKYPLVPAYLTVAFTDPAPLPAIDAGVEQHLAAASDGVLRVRRVIAWLSLLLVPATFLVGRRFLGSSWALVAAALAATSHLAIHFATQARPHGGAAPWPALTVWACLLLLERASLLRYALIACMGAMAVGTLQSSMALGFPVLVAHILAEKGALSRRHLKLLVPLAGLGLAVWFGYPFFFDAPPVEVEGKQLVQGGHKVMLNLFNGKGFGVLGWSVWSWDPALAIGAVLALPVAAVALLRRTLGRSGWRPLLVVLAYVLPMGLVLGAYARSYERFLLPLIPFLAIWIAWAAQQLARVSPRAAAGLCAGLLLVSTTVAVRLVQLRLAPNTVELAAEWIADKVPAFDSEAGAPLVWTSRPTSLPFFNATGVVKKRQINSLARALNWASYQRDVIQGAWAGESFNIELMPLEQMSMLNEMHQQPKRYLERLGDEGFVLNEVFAQGRQHRGVVARTRALRQQFEKLASFHPDGPGSQIPHPLVYQEATGVPLYHRARRVVLGQGFGPVLEMFRLGARTKE